MTPSSSETLPSRLPPEEIDPDAYGVIETLQGAGHLAYLVGGCVRDILLGGSPKDFDIATDATPREIRRLFRNCRLIGRRFLLAHIYMGPKILEVATFRGHGARGLISRDEKGEEALEQTNAFGTPEQDALSRDFTVNGLFYDPISETIIDHVHGVEDVRAKLLRTIGDADVRFIEDPVRILRAVKFGSRLGLEIPPPLREAMGKHAALIGQCPTPRVTEEIFRIMEGGGAAPALNLMVETGVIQEVLTELNTWRLAGPDHYASLHTLLSRMDAMRRAHDGLPRDFLLSVLHYLPALENARSQNDDWGLATEEWFRPEGIRMQIPVRLRSRFQVLMSMMHRMIQPETARRFKRARAMTRQRAFPQALSLLRLHVQLFGTHAEHYERWRSLGIAEGVGAAPMNDLPARTASAPKGGGGTSRGRRQGRQRRGRGRGPRKGRS